MNLLKLIAASLVAATLSMSAFAGEKVKVGFVYVGPTGDHGWTYRHDIGRQQIEEAFGDQVETHYIESVGYGADATRVFTQMAMQGYDIIFGTSFGYMDPMMEVAAKFPNVKFEHATGYKDNGTNMANYGLRLYQARHVQGVIAGMMTKTNKICYVAAYPIPEVIREINTYYLGAKSVNPDVDIDIVWVYTWYDPGKEKDAADALMNQGCDMIAQHTDSPAPLQAAEDRGHMNDGSVGMAPFTNMPDDVKAKAQEVKDAIRDGEYFAFTGPIKDNKGNLQLADGVIADRAHLDSMMYYVEGIDAELPE